MMAHPLATAAAFAILCAALTPGSIVSGCSAKPAPHAGSTVDPASGASGAQHDRARDRMVRNQIEARGIRDPRVLEAMRRVPRHLFVPEEVRPAAYEDHPLPIGHEQTISQPFIVAWMTEALQVTPRSECWDCADTFNVTTRNVTESGFEIVVTRTSSPRSIDPADLGELAEDIFGEERVRVTRRLDEGLDVAIGLAEAGGRLGGGELATGSVTMAADVRLLLGVV